MPGLRHLTYRLPERRATLAELDAKGLLASDASFLDGIGFHACRLSKTHDELEAMIVDAGRSVLRQWGGDREEIEWLLWYSGLESWKGASSTTAHGATAGHAHPPCASCENASASGPVDFAAAAHIPKQAATAADDTATSNDAPELSLFRYPVSKAQHELELFSSTALAVSQQGCSGMLATIVLAERLLRASAAGSVLCLAGDRLPSASRREILYNLMSDAAGAVLVEKHATSNRILHFVQHAMPYYWDTPLHASEILASYFPLAERLIRRTLREARLRIDDVAWFVPHNVSRRSWTILAGLLGVPEGKIWMDNIARVGHTVSCDHLINLQDMQDQGVLRRGDILLLFTFGFGANWTCMLLEH